VTAPTVQNAPRQPSRATSAASGAVATRAPTMPTVAVTAEMTPKRSGGNHAAAIFSAPMKVTVAPSPTANRPAKSIGVLEATPIATVPQPMIAPPAARTARTPNASMNSPAGTMNPAYE
jgi:hypothetical protein